MKRSSIALVLLLVLAVAGSEAKVASVTVTRADSWDVSPYIYRDFASVITGPLKMASLKGNPIVSYTIFLAEGVETNISRFDSIAVGATRFRRTGVENGQTYDMRLDSMEHSVSMGRSLEARTPGIYSVYVTADDGDGPSPPSNIVTFELMPWAPEVFDTPVVSLARSPAAGMVVLHLEPLVYRGEPDPPPYIAIYRAEGETTDPSAFQPIKGPFGVRSFRDTTLGTRTRVLEIAILGLKSGRASFQVQVQLERLAHEHGIRSNTVTLDVRGTNTPENNPTPYFNFLGVTAIVDVSHVAGSVRLHPNPADRVITLTAPLEGEAAITIVDALGVHRVRGGLDFVGGAATVDVGELSAGPYTAIIKSRGVRYTRRFVVQR